jgi:outer membrane protein OmpA-like peptidoglycan-associated protein
MNIKQIFLAVAVLCSSLCVSAQLGANQPASDTYEFNPHFFVNVQGGAGYTVGEANFSKLITPAAALNVGYNFSPIFGLRVGASGLQGKGSWTEPRSYYKYKYIQGNLDAVFNLTNAFCGWKPKRLFNGYLFVGAAFNHAYDNDDAIALANAGRQFAYLWNPTRNFVVGRAGLGANFRLCDWLAINVEVNANGLSDHFNSKHGGNIDWQFNALAGLTFTLGKSYKVIPAPVVETPVREEPKVEPQPQPKPEPKPEPVKEQPKPQPKVLPFQCNVFFGLRSYDISKTEAQKVEDLAKYLSEHPSAKVSITGYADKDTGTNTINQKLSEQRAAAVAAALVEKGVDSSRITTNAQGDNVQPFAENDDNRVAVCIAEP